MSIRRETFVDCDQCYDSYSDGSCPTVVEAREVAKRAGWHRSNGGDICPDCWEAGKR